MLIWSFLYMCFIFRCLQWENKNTIVSSSNENKEKMDQLIL